ncbi:MAG: APC family permease [Eubacterium sp.]
MNSKKKIGLLACIATGIGAIIGSGIFGSLPSEINEIGDAVIISFILAAVYKLAASFPAVYSSSIIPASGSFFLMPAKLIHPAVGLYMAVQNLLQPVLISVFAVLFSDYFCTLVPSLHGHEKIVSVAILIIYGIMAYMGTYLFASINSLIVIAMLAAVLLYIAAGIPNIDASELSLASAFGNGVRISSIGAAVSVFASCLSGGNAVSQIADDVKNPRRDIPLALILAPVIVAVVYILMAVVTLGCMEGDTVKNLSDIAKGFLPSGLVVFFIVGGPLCGVLTSMVPVIMLTCAQIQAAAECGVFPEFLAKKNKNGVSPGILLYVMLFAAVCVLTGSSFGVLMTIFSAVNALSDIPTCIVPFFLKKKYPHACNYAGIKFNYGLIAVLSVFAAITAVFLAFSAFKSLGASVYLLILAFMAAAVFYFFIRIRYLKGKGRDFIAELKSPYKAWEEREAECKTLDEAAVS